MKNEELKARYHTWDDKKLLETFKNRHDYTAEAQDALLTVIRERGLGGNMDQIVADEEESRRQNTARESARLAVDRFEYEKRMLPENFSLEEFADKSRNAQGEYASGEMLGGRYWGWMFLSIVVAMCSLIFFVVFYDGPYENVTLVTGLLFLVSTPLSIWLFIKAKARFRFFRRDEKTDVFTMEHGNFHFEAVAPFRYFFYHSDMEYRKGLLTVSHPVLWLGITNAQDETVMLSYNLTALDSAPPDWPAVTAVTVPPNARFFREIVMKRVNVLRMKKIMDSLHLSHSNSR